MSVEEARSRSRSRSALWKEMRNVEDEYYFDVRRGRNGTKGGIQLECGGKMRRLESVLLLVCLTASLLILPLVLPPLPPPPLLLLLLPICILALLMLFAFMPSNARPAAYTYL